MNRLDNIRVSSMGDLALAESRLFQVAFYFYGEPPYKMRLHRGMPARTVADGLRRLAAQIENLEVSSDG